MIVDERRGGWDLKFAENSRGVSLDMASEERLVDVLNKGTHTDRLAEALRGVAAALDSPERKEWEGLALTMQVRSQGAQAKGYRGPHFMPTVQAALAAYEGEADA